MVNVDRQGRVLVEDSLREYAEIDPGQQVMVAGNIDRLEIWSPERFARVESSGTSDMAGDESDGPAE